jgi:tetratricopeptide (TPR) repeat protein
MAVTFPLAVIVFDLTIGRWGRRDDGAEAGAADAEAAAPLGAFLRPRLRAYAALVAVTVVFLAVRELALHHVQNREGLLYFHGRETMTIAATMLQTLLVYGRLLVAPFGLVYDYGGTMPYLDSILAPRAVTGLAFVVLALCFALYLQRRRPATAFALVFFFAALLPVMNIVPTMTLMAERFLYIPSIALSVIVADVLAMAWSTRTRGALMAAAVVVAAAFGWMTHDRNDDWHDNTTLYLSAEGRTGTTLNVNLANLYARGGDLDRAEELYNEALEINPDAMNAHLNKGVLYMERYTRAKRAADQLEERGGYEAADSMRRMAEKHAAVSLDHLGRARAIDPLSPDPLYVLYKLSRLRGDLHECLRLLEEIQKVQPGYRDTDRLLQALKKRLNG